MDVFLKNTNSMRTLRSFLAGAINAAKKKAIKKGLLVKTKRKAVKNALVPMIIAQNQNINTPVAPSNMGGLGIRKRRQTKLNVTKRRH
jgi:hypothetical protein